MTDYERAMHKFRAVSAAYRNACVAFRHQVMDDVEFLAFKRRLDEAQLAADDAERAAMEAAAPTSEPCCLLVKGGA